MECVENILIQGPYIGAFGSLLLILGGGYNSFPKLTNACQDTYINIPDDLRYFYPVI